jgi:hypothetical protein
VTPGNQIRGASGAARKRNSRARASSSGRLRINAFNSFGSDVAGPAPDSQDLGRGGRDPVGAHQPLERSWAEAHFAQMRGWTDA